MKIEIRYTDASEEDCIRTDVEGQDPETGEWRVLTVSSLHPLQHAEERARELWGDDVELVDHYWA